MWIVDDSCLRNEECGYATAMWFILAQLGDRYSTHSLETICGRPIVERFQLGNFICVERNYHLAAHFMRHVVFLAKLQQGCSTFNT